MKNVPLKFSCYTKNIATIRFFVIKSGLKVLLKNACSVKLYLFFQKHNNYLANFHTLEPCLSCRIKFKGINKIVVLNQELPKLNCLEKSPLIFTLLKMELHLLSSTLIVYVLLN